MLVLIQSPKQKSSASPSLPATNGSRKNSRTPCACLKLSDRTDIQLPPEQEYPLIRTKAETEMWQHRFGKVLAWSLAARSVSPADELGAMPEGKPTTKPIEEDAAHFLVRMVRKYPHEVTIYAGGP